MQDYTRQLLDLAVKYKALRFGEFTLKSGRISPYFFNMGTIASGLGMLGLARCYQQALSQANIKYDGLFGPAYKGIPLVTSLACALAEKGQDVPFTYNRKEPKDHGEGGILVGAPLGRRMVIVDDAITAGTAVREAVDIIRNHGANVAAVIVAIDRQERGQDKRSPIQALAEDENIPTIAVATLNDVVEYVSESFDEDKISAIKAYRKEYGVA